MAENSDSVGSTSSNTGQKSQLIIWSLIMEIIKSPVNLILVGVITLLMYKIAKSQSKTEAPVKEVKKLPKLRRDFTVQELKKYNGTGKDGRILVAVNGSVYDCSRRPEFYGPGGSYSAFGGRDASRGLATFSLEALKDDYDDLSDLNSSEMAAIKEWEEQYKEHYDYVGRLLKPGEAPINYSDEEDEGSQQETELKAESQENETRIEHDGPETKKDPKVTDTKTDPKDMDATADPKETERKSDLKNTETKPDPKDTEVKTDHEETDAKSKDD